MTSDLDSPRDDALDSHAAALSVLGPTGTPPKTRAAVRRAHVLAGALVAAALLLAVTTLTGYDVTLHDGQHVPSWTFLQPAIASDFPDPGMLVVNGVYYAYATNAHGKHIQVARSPDLSHWTMLPDALPILPAWAAPNGDWEWAPEVIQIGSGFVMYYTAHDAASGRQCIGVATSERAEGPFRDTRTEPFVCQADLGGTIDASPFRDGDTLYLYFKSDGNCCHLATRLWGQRLAPDGLSLLGTPVSLVTNDQPWEGAVVEAPNMLGHDGSYYLFYSGNDYAGARYAVGYARCESPLGPCAQASDNPILASARAGSAPFVGPGGEDLFQVGGMTVMAYHAWSVTGGTPSGSRYLLIGRLGWHGTTPVVLGRATSP